MRFDDTNPVKEDQEYVDSILDAVRWLGFSTGHDGAADNLYYASDYFDRFCTRSPRPGGAGHAYVDSQSADRCAPIAAR
jgi:glutaminyl-tRNA synthetase